MIDIDKIIEEVSAQHPYKEQGNRDSYSPYNEGWSDACDVLGEKIKQALVLVGVILEGNEKTRTMENTTMIDGILYACQYLVLTRDEPFLAQELMRESGFTCQEFMNAQAKTAVEDRKMNRVILIAFGKHKSQQ